MQVDCEQCSRKSLFPMFSDRCHQFLIAWANDQDLPDCSSFSPKYFRGVDGVFHAPSHSSLG